MRGGLQRGSYTLWMKVVILCHTISTHEGNRATSEDWGCASFVDWGPSEDETVSIVMLGTPWGQKPFPLLPSSPSEK